MIFVHQYPKEQVFSCKDVWHISSSILYQKFSNYRIRKAANFEINMTITRAWCIDYHTNTVPYLKTKNSVLLMFIF